MVAVGIDLGTSNSAVAIYRKGRPQTISIDGRSVMPSCVALKPNGELIVGEQAKLRASLDPDRTVQTIKREMGNREHRVVLDQEYSPVEISAMILRKLVAAAEAETGQQIRDAVISVPAYFTNNQKEDTRQAGAQAGLNVLRLVPEPTAAAIAYGMEKGRDQTILVYDLGGGTFDVSLLKIAHNDFEVIGIGGDHDLGGIDFDNRLIDLLISELRKRAAASSKLIVDDSSLLRHLLKEAAEQAKKELSSADSAQVAVDNLLQGETFEFRISKSQYQDSIRELVVRTIDETLQTIKSAGLEPDDVDRIVLVGGSTRIPLIQESLRDRICDPYIAENVDQVVAEGAAIFAASLAAPELSADPYAPIEVRNVAAHSLGIRADADQFAVIIPKGTPIPVEANKVFTTSKSNARQTDVVVFQGEEKLCSNNSQIGGFAVTGIEKAAAGKPRIDVRFKIDIDDILSVEATDLNTRSGSNIAIEVFDPEPYSPAEQTEVSLDTLRIGVSPVGCDDAGAILQSLGLKYTKLKNNAFRKKGLNKRFDLLFINCLCDFTQIFGEGSRCSPKKNAAALKEFVQAGGVLYVSDYAFGNVSRIFPGRIEFAGKKGPAGKKSVTILTEEIQKLAGKKTATAEFGPGYVVVKSISQECTLHMTLGNEPVLVSFPEGAGHVVYTSFHNAANIDPKIAEIVGYIIMQTISYATSTSLVEIAESINLSRVN